LHADAAPGPKACDNRAVRSARFLLPAVLTASLVVGVGVAGCIDEPPPLPPPLPIAAVIRPDELHLSDIVQLTFGGENTTSRWSWGSKQVVLQTYGGPQGCERIARIDAFASPPASSPVKLGEGPAFLPGDDSVVYARTPKCKQPPKGLEGRFLDPDLHLYRAKADGTGETRLTETAGYDAEASVCGKDGSIVFTSMRDGDLDLYRMDADGTNVKRLTATAGYDGAAAFDPDCSHIVWVASRPRGRELDDYKKQLDDKRLAPATTDLWVANADGTDARQVTYTDTVVSSPTWYPHEPRVMFSSGSGSDNLRDVELWAIDVSGAALERISTAPGFDGFPTFSPDGKWLAFSSARASLLGRRDVNVFVARWGGSSRRVEERPADHLLGDSAWLADKAREGRGLGSQGLDAAGEYIERSFKTFGLTPVDGEDYRQEFDATTKVVAQTEFKVGGGAFDPAKLRAFGFSSSASVDGPLAYVGTNDDFAKLDLKGKIVVVRQQGRWSLSYTAWLARSRGAVGLVVAADGNPSEPKPESSQGIAAVMIAGDVARPLVAMLEHGAHPPAHLAVTLAPETAQEFNVVGKYLSSAPPDQKLPGFVVLAAHYDGPGPASPGANGNASGTAALLQVARTLADKKPALRRDVVLVALSGEEAGAAGADAFVKHPPGGLAAKDIVAMVNLDMVGRLRDNTVQVFGEDTATQWPDLVSGACLTARLDCVRATSGGFGARDQDVFYQAGAPVVHLFTGVSADHRQPTDTADKLNAGGMAQVARAALELVQDVSDLGSHLEYQKLTGAIESDQPEFTVSLGTIPDRAGPPNGQKGMLLAGVRPGGAADKAGLKKGDIVVLLGGHVIGRVEDVMFVLTDAKPGATLPAVVLRDGKEMKVDLVLEAAR
jgi:Tol biopolymer transport system component